MDINNIYNCTLLSVFYLIWIRNENQDPGGPLLTARCEIIQCERQHLLTVVTNPISFNYVYDDGGDNADDIWHLGFVCVLIQINSMKKRLFGIESNRKDSKKPFDMQIEMQMEFIQMFTQY